MENKQTPSEVALIKKLTGAEEVKETHISYAILGDEFVYKIKKAVDFGFLDYRLLKSRRSYCILEKELNDRFSKNVYLEVLKIVRQSKEVFALVPVENSLPAIEYVLKMKRISDDNFLATRINKGLITYNDMQKIGIQVANLLKNLENAPKDEDFKEPVDIVKFNAVENFTQTEKYVGNFIKDTSYNIIKNQTLKFLDENKEAFNNRRENGFVKNGHGDLRLEHIYFNDDESIGLIDCIEFNRRFRYIDVIAEAAFLAMELDIAGKIDLSDAFIEGFLSIYSDDNSLKLLNYYKCYLSYVRAKVTCFFLDGIDETHNLYETKKKEVERLIDLSLYYAFNMYKIPTLIFYGLMGTGKSKNSKVFADKFPIYRLNSDEVRKSLHNIEATDKVYDDFGKGLYSDEISLKIYSSMAETVKGKNKIGRSCLIDASFTKEEYSEEVKNLEKNIFIQFTAPEETILSRLNNRLLKDSVSDGRQEIYYKQKEAAKMPKGHIIETSGEVTDNIEKIIEIITNEI